ncbi:unnamed protein product [Miscanthus lutarioriparius]|uniref:Cupin type-1 domain-containing protein n=1 Tax=Miscanthus lutarioriparius TaxID=422564 RepID=A0A811NWJ2_9POAL|nr:unnamed protein product [Miscanthus lutarioriparius]
MARPRSSLLLRVVAVALVLSAAPSTLAGDPDYLQDLCVADLNSDAKLKAGFAQLAGHCRIEAVPPSAFLLCAFLSLCFGVGWNPRLVELVSKTIAQGDVFAFPRGLVHFQKNTGAEPAAVISAFNSQLPGTQSIATTLFGASPELPDEVLAKAFQIPDEEVDKIKAKFAPKKG